MPKISEKSRKPALVAELLAKIGIKKRKQVWLPYLSKAELRQLIDYFEKKNG
jgi:hypothetical protein